MDEPDDAAINSIPMTGLIYHQLKTEPVFHHSDVAAAAAAAPFVTLVHSI